MVVCLNKPRCKRFIFVNKEVGTRCKRAPEGSGELRNQLFSIKDKIYCG